MDKVSIIIPVYNSSYYLKKCIESVLEQTYKHIEIIIVDDCSTDNSFDIIEEYSKSDERIVPLRMRKNSGPSATRNFGLVHCTGDYIGFIDSDDYVELTYIETLLNSIKEEKADIAICCLSNYYHKTISKEQYYQHSFVLTLNEISNLKQVLLSPQTKKGMTGIELTGPVCKLFSSTVVKGITFDESLNLCEDVCFLIRCYDKSRKIAYNDDALYNRIIRKESLGSTRGKDYGSRIVNFINNMTEYMKNENYNKNVINQFVYDYFKEIVFYYMTCKSFGEKRKEAILRCKNNLVRYIQYEHIKDKKMLLKAMKADRYVQYMFLYVINRIFRK